VSQSFEFGSNLSSVGAYAFEVYDIVGVNINIKINRTQAFENVSTTSFGGNLNSNVSILVPANSDLYT
jgi:hypothetical protein